MLFYKQHFYKQHQAEIGENETEYDMLVSIYYAAPKQCLKLKS